MSDELTMDDAVDHENTEVVKWRDLRDQLYMLGGCKLHASYSGGGDEGSINELTLTGVTEDAIEIPRALDDEVYEAILEFISDRHGGWANNDGGSGVFDLDLVTGQIELEHYEYYTETEQHNAEIDLQE